ncbi:MAG: amidohydrolase [Gemmataceae bacterium]|nr:amidohydrolase [Gemmataceae bacterium]
MRTLFSLGLLVLSGTHLLAQAPETKVVVPKERVTAVDERVSAAVKDLVELYKDFHEHPELSLNEVRSAARLAKEAKSLGFEVTEKVGQTGVVAVLKNGAGPTVLIRADMDALPIVEQTGIPYASKVLTRDRAGREVGVMHACGHDVHMACWVGVARVLAGMKDKWSGTLVFVAQPAEEIGTGARLMLADGLYKRFPKPNYCLALHADALQEAGHIYYTEGLAMANVDTVEITVKGKGGHGAAPHATIDPIVIAAKLILDLQTIVSREMNPIDPGVVTVGSIHGGTKANIISNEVKLQITVRSTKDATRKLILEAIERKAKAAAASANAPEPEIVVLIDEFTPKLENNIDLTRKTIAVFKNVLGEDKIHTRPVIMGGEDFSRYALNGEIPVFMYFLGSVSPERMAESKKEGGKPLAGGHTDQYYPQPEPTIRTGVKTMSLAVLNLVGK